MNRLSSPALVIAALAGLSACTEKDDEAPPPPVRPVLSTVVRSVERVDARFAGTVQPRFQTDRGFQVLGRIQSYDVDVGDLVKKDQPLAALDPTPFALDVRSREGDLERARSQAANAEAGAERTRRLVAQNVSSQAELDADIQAREAGEASVRQAEAELAKAREQLGYATLLSDGDGVVTAKDADVGQTVAAGQKVMTVARTDIREAVVDLPETVVGALGRNATFRVLLQADPTITATGRVREIAPQADAATRTRRVRITLDDPSPAFRLGTTITATPVSPPREGEPVELPRSAILQKDGAARVWLVDTAARTVRTVPVELASGSQSDGVARVSGGLTAGQRVVVAGVHALTEGQEVKLDEESGS
ncbi:efflux RND transporter periplasmic adaptor subunit [Aureimonas psammosilenae]|uniref:efflux RND transporter periplasmic adaptor subunit n=1 Tax=Aureimonas psammosilenae TaxID=2495496 RepID=UPI001260A33D|nr:efflux RND transporter periplasmic adaptor subunit [Aureimonas psammosilenae]